MILVLAIVALWLATGWLGSMLALRYGFKDLGVDGEDLLFGAFMTLFGPINLLAGLAFILGHKADRWDGNAPLLRRVFRVNALRK